jgi:hypothetical protein
MHFVLWVSMCLAFKIKVRHKQLKYTLMIRILLKNSCTKICNLTYFDLVSHRRIKYRLQAIIYLRRLNLEVHAMSVSMHAVCIKNNTRFNVFILLIFSLSPCKQKHSYNSVTTQQKTALITLQKLNYNLKCFCFLSTVLFSAFSRCVSARF